MRRIAIRLGATGIGLAALLAGAPFVAPARAGAWTPEAGQGEIIVSTLFDQSNEGFNQVGRFTPTPLYRNFMASVRVAYGVTDWLAALVKPALQSATLGAPANQTYTGFGDSEMGVEARVWRDDTSVVSVQATTGLTGVIGAAGNGPSSANEAFYDFRLLLGKNVSLGALPAFFDIEAGYRLRGGAAPDEGRADLTFGVYVTPKIMLMAQSFNIVSAPSRNPNFPQWAQSKAQFSLVYQFDPVWRVQVGGFTTVAGKNAYRESGAVLALWRRF